MNFKNSRNVTHNFRLIQAKYIAKQNQIRKHNQKVALAKRQQEEQQRQQEEQQRQQEEQQRQQEEQQRQQEQQEQQEQQQRQQRQQEQQEQQEEQQRQQEEVKISLCIEELSNPQVIEQPVIEQPVIEQHVIQNNITNSRLKQNTNNEVLLTKKMLEKNYIRDFVLGGGLF